MFWWRFDLTGQMGRRGLQRSATVQRLDRRRNVAGRGCRTFKWNFGRKENQLSMATTDAAIKTYLAPVI